MSTVELLSSLSKSEPLHLSIRNPPASRPHRTKSATHFARNPHFLALKLLYLWMDISTFAIALLPCKPVFIKSNVLNGMNTVSRIYSAAGVVACLVHLSVALDLQITCN